MRPKRVAVGVPLEISMIWPRSILSGIASPLNGLVGVVFFLVDGWSNGRLPGSPFAVVCVGIMNSSLKVAKIGSMPV